MAAAVVVGWSGAAVNAKPQTSSTPTDLYACKLNYSIAVAVKEFQFSDSATTRKIFC